MLGLSDSGVGIHGVGGDITAMNPSIGRRWSFILVVIVCMEGVDISNHSIYVQLFVQISFK